MGVLIYEKEGVCVCCVLEFPARIRILKYELVSVNGIWIMLVCVWKVLFWLHRGVNESCIYIYISTY